MHLDNKKKYKYIFSILQEIYRIINAKNLHTVLLQFLF